MKKRGKRKYLNFSGIRVTGSGRLKGTLSLVRQVLEDNERAMDFVNLHRFTTRSAFGIKERKVFVFVRMGKFAGFNFGIPITGLFVTGKLIDYPQTVKLFEKSFKESLAWSYKNVDKAVEITSKQLGIPTNVLKASLERSQYNYISATECRDEVLAYLKKLNELYPNGMPKVPDEKFFYIVK